MPSDVAMGPKLNSCTYLRACIDESMRLAPPVGAALWRRVLTNDTIVDGHVMPEGCDVGTSIYSIHHNPDYYPEPFEFRPERWLGEDKSKTEVAVSAFNPFSVGARGCIGKGLALVELMLIQALLLVSYDIRLSGGNNGSDGIRSPQFQTREHVTGAKNGPVLRFRRRFE
jgi:cytochrome P450